MSLSLQEKESLRHAALAFLAPRQRAAFSPGQARALMRARRMVDFDYTENDLADAMEFLVGQDHARRQSDSMGATVYYQATSTGVLAHERRAADLGLED